MQDHLRLDPIFPFSCRQTEGKALFLLGGREKKVQGRKLKKEKKNQKEVNLLVSQSGGLMWDCDVRPRTMRSGRKRQKRREGGRNEGVEMRVFILYLCSAHWSVFVSVIPLMYR